jgi:hypothetical protein
MGWEKKVLQLVGLSNLGALRARTLLKQTIKQSQASQQLPYHQHRTQEALSLETI